MERVPIDVWESCIVNLLSDKDLIALCRASPAVCKKLEKPDMWIRLFWKRWMIIKLDNVSVFEDITREYYFSVATEYQEFIEKGFCFYPEELCVYLDDLYCVYAKVKKYCKFCDCYHTRRTDELPTFFPVSEFERITYEKKSYAPAPPYIQDDLEVFNRVPLMHIIPFKKRYYLPGNPFKMDRSIDFIFQSWIEKSMKELQNDLKEKILKIQIKKQASNSKNLRNLKNRKTHLVKKGDFVNNTFVQKEKFRYGNSRKFCNNYKPTEYRIKK